MGRSAVMDSWALIINLGMLDLSYWFQTFQTYINQKPICPYLKILIFGFYIYYLLEISYGFELGMVIPDTLLCLSYLLSFAFMNVTFFFLLIQEFLSLRVCVSVWIRTSVCKLAIQISSKRKDRLTCTEVFIYILSYTIHPFSNLTIPFSFFVAF